MNIEEYITHWDKVIEQWAGAEKPGFPDAEKYWETTPYVKRRNKSVAERIGLQKELIPQPYWGDPRNCSAVVLNYNPGGSKETDPEVLLQKDHSSLKFAKLADNNTLAGVAAKNYSRTALIVPDFSEELSGFWTVKEHEAAWKWMKRHTEWVDRLFPNTGKKPCFMEICAWHSHNWRNVRVPDQIIEILKRDFAPVLEEAILNSDSKIGLAIGASFKGEDSILVKLGYEDVTEELFNADTLSKEGVNRWYKVFRNEGGAVILVTWSTGSNHQPSSDFNCLERGWIDKINQSSSSMLDRFLSSSAEEANKISAGLFASGIFKPNR